MGGLPNSVEGVGYREVNPQETQEKQRLLALLSRPNTRFRVQTDYNYNLEQDERMDPKSKEYTHFEQILIDDWRNLAAQQKPEGQKQEDFEKEWLSPLAIEEVENIIQGWIDAAREESTKEFYRNYQKAVIQNIRDYERGLSEQAEEQSRKDSSRDINDQSDVEGEARKLSIPENCAVALEFGPSFDQDEKIQRRYQTKERYLQHVLMQILSGFIGAPEGFSKNRKDLLRPLDKEEIKEKFPFVSLPAFVPAAKAGTLRHRSLFPATAQQASGGLEETLKPGAGTDSAEASVVPVTANEATRPEDLEEQPSEEEKTVGERAQKLFEKWKAENTVAVKLVELRSGARLLVKDPQFHLSDKGFLSIEYKSDDYFDGAYTENNKHLKIKLPPEAVVGYQRGEEGRNNIHDVVVEVLQANEGSPHPKFYLENNQLALGLGDARNPSTQLIRFESANLRAAVERDYPKVAEQLSWYLEGKENAFKRPTSDEDRARKRQEAKKLKDFERFQLAKCVIKMGESDQRLEMATHFWSKVFKERWEEKVGEEKLAELKRQVEELPVSPVVTRTPRPRVASERGGGFKKPEDRWDISAERLQDPEFRQRAEKFLQAVRSENASWEEALRNSTKLASLAHSMKLTVPETYNMLGEEILGVPERQDEYQEFLYLLNLRRNQMQQYLKGPRWKMSDDDLANRSRMLRNVLLWYLKEKPLPTDKWTRGEQALAPRVRTAGDRRQVRPETRDTVKTTPEGTFDRTRINQILEKIRSRSKAKVLAESYNPDDEREFEAAI